MSPSSQATTSRSYYLFGFPIAHSTSPALHNYLFTRLGLLRTYKLAQTLHVGRRMRALCRADDFGGASVTMPLKVAVSDMLDRVTDEARAIGAVNTIVPEEDEQGKTQLVGTNTDWLGVRNALLHALFTSTAMPVVEPVFAPSTAAALVIGGGGAARAAVYALASLNCAPVYLVGRDANELAALVAQFPHIPCVPVVDAARVSNVMLAVSCVPAVTPVSHEECAADACARVILASPHSSARAGIEGPRFLPYTRVFLDMCYKPRSTPLMQYAAGEGWTTVSGIEAMLEQGLAQARMWLAESISPEVTTGLIPHHIEEDARRLIRDMPDIVVRPGEERVPEDERQDIQPAFGARL